jgi:hypothetical protein
MNQSHKDTIDIVAAENKNLKKKKNICQTLFFEANFDVTI